jgi:hypothetical protein
MTGTAGLEEGQEEIMDAAREKVWVRPKVVCASAVSKLYSDSQARGIGLHLVRFSEKL